MKKTIAQQLGITEFPFEIKDKEGRLLYFEDSNNDWERRERDSDGYLIFYEDSDGKIIDYRPKEATNKEHFGSILIKDTDIATIERLHDMVLDAGLPEIDSEELKRSRELTKKMYTSIYPDY